MKPYRQAVPSSHPQRPNQYQGGGSSSPPPIDPSVDLPWDQVTGTPTTIAGYGILDAYTQTEVDALLRKSLASVPKLRGEPGERGPRGVSGRDGIAGASGMFFDLDGGEPGTIYGGGFDFDAGGP